MNSLLKINRDQYQNFLCAAVRSDTAPELLLQYHELDDQKLFQMAVQNRVSSIVAHSLSGVLGEGQTPPHWLIAHSQISARLQEYLNELDRLAEIFFHHGFQAVALKNAGIARGLQVCLGCCPMGDIDLLIDQENFDQAHRILLAEGYCLKFRNSLIVSTLKAAHDEGGGEYYKILSSGEKFWLEISWRAVSGRWMNVAQEPPTNELFARSREIENTKVRLLSPEDNLLQVCLHTAKHSYVRAPGFRLHLDVERLVAKQIINWTLFIKTVKRLQVRTPVFFSLLLPKILFNSNIPDYVMVELTPPSLRRRLIFNKIIKAGIFNPDQKKFSSLNYLFFNALLYDNVSLMIKNLFYHARTIQGLGKLLFRRINT